MEHIEKPTAVRFNSVHVSIAMIYYVFGSHMVTY